MSLHYLVKLKMFIARALLSYCC